jgi:hypothetical protein
MRSGRKRERETNREREREERKDLKTNRKIYK